MTQAVKTMDPAMVVCVSVIMGSQGDVVKSVSYFEVSTQLRFASILEGCL